MAATRSERIDARSLVEAALYVIDNEGLEAFSIRRLAETAGVFVNSVTHHLGSRSTVLAAVLDRVLAEIPPPVDDPSPGRALLAHAEAVWAILARHRAVLPVLAQHLESGPEAVRVRRQVRALLIAHDVAEPDVAVDAFLTAVVGGAVLHWQGPRTPVPGTGGGVLIHDPEDQSYELPSSIALLIAGFAPGR